LACRWISSNAVESVVASSVLMVVSGIVFWFRWYVGKLLMRGRARSISRVRAGNIRGGLGG
jgi:hypothetical protein